MSEITEMYDNAADEYTRAFFNQEALQAEQYYLEEFVSYLPAGGRVLDVGCGPGIEARFFLDRGIRYEGIDLSVRMISIARERNPGAVFRLLDMRKMDYREHEFDGIMALESVIHFPKSEVEQIMRRFHTMLRNRGVLLLALQEGEGEQKLPFPFEPKRKVLLNFYRQSELRELVSRTGFRVMSISVRQSLPDEFPFHKLIAIGQKISSENRRRK